MALILNIETATRNCSVSLAKDGENIICIEVAEQQFTHAEKLHGFIEDVLAQSKVAMSELDAIAISKGPGSYTGLRIGVSSVKGLCYALEIPMIAVDTLEILARQIKIEEGIVVPMIDARRMEVYTAKFDENYSKIENTEAIVITENTFNEYEKTLHLIGDGALKCREITDNSNVVFYPEVQFPSAKDMSKISYNMYKISDLVDVAYFEPYYLKDFVLNK